MKNNLKFSIFADDKFSRTFGKLNKKLTETAKLRKSFTAMAGGGAKMALGGVGILYGINKSIEGAEKFQETFSDVSKVLNGFTENEIAGVREGILELTKTIPLLPQELNVITEAGAKMGLPKDSLLGFTEVVAKASTALGLSTEEISANFGKISGIYGVKSTEGLKEVGDVVNYLADNLETDGANIINVMKRIGANTKNLEISPNVSAGIAAAFDKLGVSPEKAATAFNSMIDNFSKNERFKLMLETEGEGGLRKILTEISNMDKSSRSSFIQEIAGSGGDAVMLKSLTNDIGVYVDALNKATDKEKYSGSLQREFEIKSKTLTAQKKLLANAIQRLSISMTPFLEVLTKIINKVIPVIDTFSKWITENKKLATVLLSIAGAVGAMVAVMGGLGVVVGIVGSAMTIVLPVMSGLGVVVGIIGSAMTLVIPILTSSVGLLKLIAIGVRALTVALVSSGIGAIIVGVGLAVWVIYENWELIVSKVSQFGKYLANAFPIVGKIASAISGFFGDDEKNITAKKVTTINQGKKPQAELNVNVTDNRTTVQTGVNQGVATKVKNTGRSQAGLGLGEFTYAP